MIPKSKLLSPIILLPMLTRVITALLILPFPLVGWAVAFILDSLDNPVWVILGKLNQTQYHWLDKKVDWAVYLAMFLALVSRTHWLLPTILLLYRFIGQIIFELNHDHRTFLIFFNFFEVYFLWYFQPFGHTLNALVIVFLLKILQEIWIHQTSVNILNKLGDYRIHS